MVGRLRHLEDTANLEDGIALSDQLLGGIALTDDLLCHVRYVVESPTQSGRLRTLIQPGS